MLATPSHIIAAVERVVSRFGPARIILFGSYAYGTPTFDSDVDLLILKDFVGSPHRQFALVRGTLDVPFPLDVLVRRPADVARRIAAGDCFLGEVVSKGIVLYDAADARVGRQGRRATTTSFRSCSGRGSRAGMTRLASTPSSASRSTSRQD